MREEFYLDCYTGTIEGDKLYIVSVEFGLLLEYSIHDFSYKILGKIHLPNPRTTVRVNTMIKSEEYIYMTINNNWNVIEYNINNGQTTIYGNDDEYIEGKDVVIKSTLFQECLWIFPYSVCQPIRIFNLKTKTFKEGLTIQDILPVNEYEKGTDYYMNLDVFQEGNVLRTAVRNSPYIIEIDMETCKYCVYETKESAKICSMSYNNGQYWIAYVGSKSFVKWHPENGVVEEYEIRHIQLQNDISYRYIYADEDKIIVIPIRDNDIYIIDKKTKEIQSLIYPDDLKRAHNLQRCMFYGILQQKNILLLPFSVNYFFEINISENVLQAYSCNLNRMDIGKKYIESNPTNNFFSEIDYYTLSDYVGGIKKNTFCLTRIAKMNSKGGEIWRQLNAY